MSSGPQAVSTSPPGALAVDAVRADFPILGRQVRGRPLVYLDNAATAQKPQCVIDALSEYYRRYNANVHRGVHVLSEEATAAYEGARSRIRQWLNAASDQEIVFVRGATEGINLVANSYGGSCLKPGDEVLITELEHHSNIVPWQLVCERTGARLRYVPIDERGELELEGLDELLNERTAIVAVGHVSNALGTINPVREFIARAHQVGARVLLDGAQAMPHAAVDVRELDCDFYVFSGHKLFAPTGTGVLYARRSLLEQMPPWQGGGDMIRSVSMQGSSWHELPWRFEAGTPHIAGFIGLASALDYLEQLGMDNIQAHEQTLLDHATECLREIPGLRLVGTARHKTALLSFVLDGVHPHDIGTVLDGEGIAIRTGHHCAMPVMEKYRIPATARASFAFYNTLEEAERLAEAVRGCARMFA